MYKSIFHKKDLSPLRFLITGGAGFIGSNIAHYLLKYGAAEVRVLDNLATGFESNTKLYAAHKNYRFIQGDITKPEDCITATKGVDIILHQAALGSVPRSVKDPLATNMANVNGFINILTAAKDNGVKRIVYASSSSVYGDNPKLPKAEEDLGKQLSPYAVSKYVDELYAQVYARCYGLELIGLRYFNVFGPLQSPDGAYAAVIPLFIHHIMNNAAPTINGDGSQTRDFTFVENAVQANILAATTDNPEAINQVYNVAVGERISLVQLYDYLLEISGKDVKPIFGPNRAGDIPHSLADISKAKKLLGYDPQITVREGLQNTFEWFSSPKPH